MFAMKNYLIDKKFSILAIADGSLGSQPKFHKDEYWYKYNHVGNEGLAEQLVSDLLDCSTLTDFVKYEACLINGRSGCRSKDMLAPGESLIPFSRLYENVTGRIFVEDINALPDKDRFTYIVDFIRDTTDVDCSRYLFDTLCLDMLTRNVDRHYKNLALIQSADGEFRVAPIFDNGQGLLQNFTITPPGIEFDEAESLLTSCTISGSFEKQYLLAKEATGFEPFHIDYDKLSLKLEEYDDSIAKSYLEFSLERYKGIFAEIQLQGQDASDTQDDIDLSDDDDDFDLADD